MMNINFGNDFRIILICNAYSTNQEYFARPMNVLVDALSNKPSVIGPGSGNTAGTNATGSVTGLSGNTAGVTGSAGAGGSGGVSAVGCSTPFSMVVLDSLTVHSKMSLIHGFVSQMIKLSQCKTSAPTPGLVETYARLLVYTEIESLGIKGFLSKYIKLLHTHTHLLLNSLLLLSYLTINWYFYYNHFLYIFSSIITHCF